MFFSCRCFSHGWIFKRFVCIIGNTSTFITWEKPATFDIPNWILQDTRTELFKIHKQGLFREDCNKLDPRLKQTQGLMKRVPSYKQQELCFSLPNSGWLQFQPSFLAHGFWGLFQSVWHNSGFHTVLYPELFYLHALLFRYTF